MKAPTGTREGEQGNRKRFEGFGELDVERDGWVADASVGLLAYHLSF